MMASVDIQPATAGDETEWRRLWAGYCAFYGIDLPEATTAETWRRILDPGFPIHALLARRPDGTLAGFCHHVIHANTWSPNPDCYLEDLFTDPQDRGRGIGRALIEQLVGLAQTNGWRRVYWHTAETNTTARALYDKVTGGRDAFVRYAITVRPLAS